MVRVRYLCSKVCLGKSVERRKNGKKLCKCWGKTRRMKSTVSASTVVVPAHDSSTVAEGLMIEAEDARDRRAPTDALATAAAARLTSAPNSSGKKKEETAATKIQAAFRGYLTRRAITALNGPARLKSFVGGQYAKRQSASSSKYLQRRARLQSKVCATRMKLSEDNSAGEERGKDLHEKMQTWRTAANVVNHTFMDPNNPRWGWGWSERWMAVTPLIEKGALDNERKGDTLSTKSNASTVAVSAQVDNLVPMKNSTTDSVSAQVNTNAPSPKSVHHILPNSGKLRSSTPKGSANSRNDDSTTIYSVQSYQCQRRGSRRLSVGDDASLASCPGAARRGYLASTVSSRAKARLRSPLGMVRGVSRTTLPCSAQRRLTFPADRERHSGPLMAHTTFLYKGW